MKKTHYNIAAKFFGCMAVAVILLTAPSCLAADTTSAPSTAPATAAPTQEQADFIKKVHSQPIDEPFAKYDIHVANKDGSPNPNFGKLDAHFSTKHEEFLKRGKSGPIGVLFLGDSITEGWGGGGKKVWAEEYGKLDPANFGISGDQTEHVLWRIANGELDGISPKVVVLMIGTNNIGYPADQIAAADTKIVEQIHAKLPDTKLLLLGIFPRGADPTNTGTAGMREKIKTVNLALAKLDDGSKTRYLDIGDKFLTPEGALGKDIMPDALHPNAKGYQIWADAMRPLLDEMLKG
jgi:lysophospholipase L1-like esterase